MSQMYNPLPSSPYDGNRMKNALGVWALILGIGTFVFSWVPFLGFGSYATGIVGLVLGLYGIRRANHNVASNRGVSIAGVVLSTVGLLSVVLATLTYSAAFYQGYKSATEPTSKPHVISIVTSSDSPSDSPSAKATRKHRTTLLDVHGSGIKKTKRFTVTADEWKIHYSYDCSNFGSKGNFAVTVYQDGTLTDVAVNELDRKGKSSTYEDGAGTYRLDVNSECDWHVKVTQ